MANHREHNEARPVPKRTQPLRTVSAESDLLWALEIQVERGLRAGDTPRLRELNAKLLALYADDLQSAHPEAVEQLNALAKRYADAEHPELATELLQELCKALRTALGDDDPRFLSELELLASQAECLMECHMGDAVWARELIWESKSRTLGELHPETLKALEQFAWTCDVNLNWTSAAKRYEQLYDARRRALGEHDPLTLEALEHYLFISFVYLDGEEEFDELGGYEHLLPYCLRHCEETLRVYGEADVFSANALAQLAQCYEGLGEMEQAYQSWERAHRVSCQAEGEDSADAMVYLHNWALSCERFGEFDRALPLWRKLYEVRSAQGFDASEALAHIETCEKNKQS